MKNLYKKISILFSIFIVLVSLISVFITNTNYTTSNNVVRNIEIEEINIDSNNSLEKFDNYDLTYNETSVSFVGYNIIDSDFFDDLDLVSVSNNNTVITKYECNYDYEYGIVSLSVLLVDNIETTLLDTIYGVIITNDDNEFDVLFDVDGEILLLSELGDVSSIENCGFFSKLKKVWNTTSGKIGTIATVATCAVVGTICAVIPGGQLVTAACIGAAVGFIGGAITAGVSTYLVDGKIDWGAVFSYAGAGAVVGSMSSTIAYKVTLVVKSIIVKSNGTSNLTNDLSELNKICDKSLKACDLNKQNHILQSKHAWNKVCDGSWKEVSKIIKKTIVDGSASEGVQNAENIIFTLSYNGQTVSVTTRIVNGIFKIVDSWIVV